MDKYGIMADEIKCTKCKGEGKLNLGRSHFTPCDRCNGTGRKGGVVDPVKEAEATKKQIENKNGDKNE